MELSVQLKFISLTLKGAAVKLVGAEGGASGFELSETVKIENDVTPTVIFLVADTS